MGETLGFIYTKIAIDYVQNPNMGRKNQLKLECHANNIIRISNRIQFVDIAKVVEQELSGLRKSRVTCVGVIQAINVRISGIDKNVRSQLGTLG